jgi:hypothetical protein
MTTDGTRSALLSDEQLAGILRFVARTCLEVERGLRPPAHLRALMDPAIAHAWAQPGKLGRFRGGPVQAGQIGQPQVSRLTDTHIFATVVTCTEGDRWGAISLELRAQRGRWRIADLQRLLAATQYHTAPTAAEFRGSHDDLPHVAEERRLAEAALGATRRRLADLTPDAPGHRVAQDLVRYWDL